MNASSGFESENTMALPSSRPKSGFRPIGNNHSELRNFHTSTPFHPILHVRREHPPWRSEWPAQGPFGPSLRNMKIRVKLGTERLSKNQPIDLTWSGVLNRLEVKPLIPPLPNPSPARGEGLLAVANPIGTGLT